MYIVFNDKIIESKEIKEIIEKNSEFKVVKDMSKGTKRDDVLAFNLSIDIELLNEFIEEEFSIDELSEDELFEEYLTLSEDIATDLEEYFPEDSILDVRAYKWDKSDNGVKLIIAVAHNEIGEAKLRGVMKKLITQAE